MTKYVDIDAVKEAVRGAECDADWDGRSFDAEFIENALDFIPRADVAPVVHGQWIEDHDYLKCPECGVMVKWDFTFFDIGNWNYCPNCGAKMDIEDGGDNNEAD